MVSGRVLVGRCVEVGALVMVPLDVDESDSPPLSFGSFPSLSIRAELVPFDANEDEVGIVVGVGLLSLLTTSKLCETALWTIKAKHSKAHRRAVLGSMV